MAVKVRRPGIVGEVERDLAILQLVASIVQKLSRRARRHNVVGTVARLAEMVHAELDLAGEAENCEQLREVLSNETQAVVPMVHRQWTRQNLLVMEYIPGTALSNKTEIAASGFDNSQLALTIMSAALRIVATPEVPLGSTSGQHTGPHRRKDRHSRFRRLRDHRCQTRDGLTRLLVAIATHNAAKT